MKSVFQRLKMGTLQEYNLEKLNISQEQVSRDKKENITFKIMLLQKHFILVILCKR